MVSASSPAPDSRRYSQSACVALRKGPRAQTAVADSDPVVGGSLAGMIVAALCFLVVLAAIGWGSTRSTRSAPAPANSHGPHRVCGCLTERV